MAAITTAASERDDGLLTAEERTAFDTHAATVAQLDGDIARVKSQIEATRTSAGVEIGSGAITTTDNLRDARNHGFRSFGEFAFACVRAAVDPSAQADDRLQIGAASTAPAATATHKAAPTAATWCRLSSAPPSSRRPTARTTASCP